MRGDLYPSAKVIIMPQKAVVQPALPPVNQTRVDRMPPPDGKFVDPEFPPVNASITKNVTQSDHFQSILSSMSRGVTWRRGSEFTTRLFNDVHPNDIWQGSVGNCWLLAGISALAEYPGRIQSLFKESEISHNGMYHVRMYDVNTRQWTWVTIDDYIPHTWQGGELKPLGARPQGDELWVLLIEKACAKWFGGYAKINGGNALDSLMVLCESTKYLAFGQRQLGAGSYDVSQWVVKVASYRSARDRNSYQEQHIGNSNSDHLFAEIQQADLEKCIMVAWSMKDPPPASVRGHGPMGEPIASDGIIKGHAYALIGVEAIQCSDGRIWRIVQIRNPWGGIPGSEWTGTFSDTWPGWAQYPDLKSKIGIGASDALDGLFCMPWEDFIHRFSDLGIAYTTSEGGNTKLGKQQFEKAKAGPQRRAGAAYAAPAEDSSACPKPMASSSSTQTQTRRPALPPKPTFPPPAIDDPKECAQNVASKTVACGSGPTLDEDDQSRVESIMQCASPTRARAQRVASLAAEFRSQDRRSVVLEAARVLIEQVA